MEIHHTQVAFDETSEGLIIERSQYIDPQYLDSLKEQRSNSMSVRENDYMRVASIPVAVVDKWLSQGFPFWEASAKEIVAKLRMENLDDFLTTNKQL